MYSGPDKFEPFTLQNKTKLPLVLNKTDQVETVTILKKNYGAITKSHPLDDKELFVIFNAEIELFAGTGRATNSITIEHPFACDIEGDPARMATFDVDAVQFISSYNNSIEYTAYLRSMNFYNPSEASPFDGIVEEEDDENNFGFPYLPPEANLEGVSLPTSISIKHLYLTNAAQRKHILDKYGK